MGPELRKCLLFLRGKIVACAQCAEDTCQSNIRKVFKTGILLQVYIGLFMCNSKPVTCVVKDVFWIKIIELVDI